MKNKIKEKICEQLFYLLPNRVVYFAGLSVLSYFFVKNNLPKNNLSDIRAVESLSMFYQDCVKK